MSPSPSLVSMVHDRRRRKSRPPILLVPGSFSGAWIWRHNFQTNLHRAGYDVHAMSFKAHGRRGLPLNRRGLQDYVQDLQEAVESLPTPPVLIAHSLGGLIALRLAASMPLPGVALLAPIPAQGAWRSLLGLAVRSPTSFAKLLTVTVAPGVAMYGRAPDGIYGPNTEPKRAADIARQLQAESLRALIEAMWPSRIAAEQVQAPLHFFAADQDHVIAADEVKRCAEAFDAPFTLYEGMAHTFQAERDYALVCRDLVRWIRSLN